MNKKQRFKLAICCTCVLLLEGPVSAEIRIPPTPAQDGHGDFVQDYAGIINDGSDIDRIGEAQRVALARAVINRPKILLLDEPLSALDLSLRQNLREELVDMQRTLGITFLFVTHDQEEALSMSTRIVLMKSGKIEQLSKPEELYEKPITSFAAKFMGFTNVFSISDLNNINTNNLVDYLEAEELHANKLCFRSKDIDFTISDQGSFRVISKNY